jgi:thiamine pyrophosphate-dependent acetolactate synthase large subunit-like protein
MGTFKPITKWTGKVDRIRDVAYVFREALRQALYGTPGPVYIEFNLDTLLPFPEVKKELDRRGHNWWLDYYIQNLFAAGFDVGREIRPWPIEIPFPKKELVAKTVKAITKAERPLIIVGSQVSQPPIDDAKIRSILQEMGVPCFFEGTARGVLPASSHLYLKHGLVEALEAADLVLVLGVPADFKVKKLSSKTQLIVANRTKTALKANVSAFGDHAQQIHTDIGQFLVEVSEKLGRFAISEQYLNDVKRRNLDAENAARAANPLAAALNDSLGENAVIVSDGGDFANALQPVLSSRGSWVESASSAKLGALAGYAIGSKFARPESNVTVLLGLESLGYSLSELATAANSSSPFLALIGNDGSSRSIVDPSTGSNYANIEKAAQELGAQAFAVSQKDAKAVSQTLAQSVSALKDKPVVVNVLLQ